MSRRRAGISLVEVAVAILLTGLAIGPLYEAIVAGGRQSVATREEVLACGHAADVLDYAQGLPFDDPFLAVGTRDCPQLPGRTLPLPDRFRRTVAVAETRVAGSPWRYKVLAVRVAWEAGGPAHCFQVTRLLFAGGLP